MENILHQIEGSSHWVTVLTLLLLLIWEGYAPFFSFFRQQMKQRAHHALRNFLLTIMNAIMVSLLFIGLWSMAADYVAGHHLGLLNQLSLPLWGTALTAVLLFDFWTYWWHRFNHVIPFLWRFHRVHHSDPKMDVTSANRFHIGEIFISSVLRVPLIILFGAELWHLALYEALMFPIVQFHHANISLPPYLDRLLRIFIVTPNMHKVHHSRYHKETDSNYTSMLSIWDRLFGSFRLSKDPSSIQFGLKYFDGDNKQSVLGMLATPVTRASSTQTSKNS